MYLPGSTYVKPYSSCWSEAPERTPCTEEPIFMASPVSCTFTDEAITMEKKRCTEGIYL